MSRSSRLGDEHFHRLPQQNVSRVSEERGESSIEVSDATLLVDDREPIKRRLEQRLVLPLGGLARDQETDQRRHGSHESQHLLVPFFARLREELQYAEGGSSRHDGADGGCPELLECRSGPRRRTLVRQVCDPEW